MLQKSRSLLLDKLVDHVAQHRSDSIKTLVCRADVIESVVVEENLLDNEDGNSLAQLGTSLHDAKAEWNDLGGKKEVDHI